APARSGPGAVAAVDLERARAGRCSRARRGYPILAVSHRVQLLLGIVAMLAVGTALGTALGLVAVPERAPPPPASPSPAAELGSESGPPVASETASDNLLLEPPA